MVAKRGPDDFRSARRELEIDASEGVPVDRDLWESVLSTVFDREGIWVRRVILKEQTTGEYLHVVLP